MQAQATYFPTYGFRAGREWQIPIRVWLHANHEMLEHVFAKVVGKFHNLTPQERQNFRARTADLMSEDIKHVVVTIVFDVDQQRRAFPILDSAAAPIRSDLNGVIDGSIHLPVPLADQLLAAQSSPYGWLSLRSDQGPPGSGRVQLLEEQGESVISDIDDTVKITEIPAGPKIVARNTFFRDFVAVEGMASQYKSLQVDSFHYVSGAPWQLFSPEARFLLDDAHFPEGTFNLKTLDRNLLSKETWENLEDFAAHRFDTTQATLQQKVRQITQLLTNLPRRKFTLFGDSGEKDPEVYRKIRAKFPRSIRNIFIRDVVDDREKNASRLEGMTIIEAPAIVHGRSQFDQND